MHQLRLICFTICVVTIVLSVLLGLALIWADLPQDVGLKSFLTLLLIGGASLACGLVSLMLDPKK